MAQAKHRCYTYVMDKSWPVFRPVGHFVLRSPLLSLESLGQWPTERSGARAALAAILARPDVLEAIAFAAPSVAQGIADWLARPDSEHGRKLERALMSYVQRLATRSTPFGLFAGVSLGKVTRRTVLALAATENNRRCSRPDMSVLQSLCDRLLANEDIRNNVALAANDTLIQVGERIHFIKAAQAGGARRYTLGSADALEVLPQVLDLARAGQKLPAIVDALCRDNPEVDRADLAAFVGQLVDEQILVMQLQPLLTVRDAAEDLLEHLAAIPQALEQRTHLQALVAGLRAVDRAAPNPAPMAGVLTALEALGQQGELGRLIQVDMWKPSEALEISQGVALAIGRAAAQCSAVFGATPSLVDRVRETFERRYEDAEVPLLEALDAEAGTGFGDAGHSALDTALTLGVAFGGSSTLRMAASRPVSLWLEDIIGRATMSGSIEVELDPRELEQHGHVPTLPESFACRAVLIGGEGTGSAPQSILLGVVGPSSEVMNGRLAWLDDGLREAVSAAIRAEEALRPEALFVDIVHTPEGRHGNLIARPALRAYELPILSRSGAPPDKQIALSSLMLSLRDGRFVLRSKDTGREIIPRLTSAHNYVESGVPVYRFLAGMMVQGIRLGVTWDWLHYDHAPFLPRVKYGDVILSEAKWNLTKSTLHALTSGQDFLVLAERMHWPRFLRCSDGGSALSIDLENPLSVDTFLDTYGKRDALRLEEDLLRTRGSPLRGPEGSYANEVVISYASTARLQPPLPAVARQSLADRAVAESALADRAVSDRAVSDLAAQRFVVGDEWLYVRLYVAATTSDILLTAILQPFAAWAKASGGCSAWFFIRYFDPDHHLRIRFRGDPAFLHAQLLPRLRTALEQPLSAGLVSRIELGTYVRESARYGGARGITLAERWFEADSEAVVALIAACESSPDELDLRWRSALLAVRDDLSLLVPDPHLQMRVLGGIRQTMFEEFGGSAQLEASLSRKFRSLQNDSGAWLSGTSGHANYPALAALLVARSARVRVIAGEIHELAAQKLLFAPLASLASSLVHMHCNRLLRGHHRQHELVIYDVLLRWLRSHLARKG